MLIEQSSSYDRTWIRKDSALKATLVEDPAAQNPNFWVWENPASLELQNEDGSPFYFHGDYLYAQSTFSENGRWMVFFDTSGYLVRVDFETLKISAYRVATAEKYFWPAIAISDSGRYIAVNNRVDEFYIMDTADCTMEADRIIIPGGISDCAKRSIKQYALEYFEDLYQTWLEFYNDNIARVKGLSKDGVSGEEIIIRAPNTKLGTNYIALGDSYSSGEGAYSYLPGTDEPNNRCHISNRSYPFLLGDWLKLDSTHSVACSGAMIHNIAGGHRNDAAQNSRPTQDRTLGKWIPGYKWQIEHVRDSSNPVDIVTIGISGNDIGFADKLVECLKPGTCFSSSYDRVGIALEINYQFDKLVTIFSSLRSQALKRSPTARVYAIGYPQVFDITGSHQGLCGNNVRLNYQEVLMASNVIDYLNLVIRAASERAGIAYIPINGALGSSALCGKSPSKGVNGLTPGDGGFRFYSGPVAIESFHPSYYGHTLITEAIRNQTEDFGKSLPRPNYHIAAPSVLKSQLVLNSEDMTGNVRRFIYGSDITPTMVYKRGNQYIFIGDRYDLKVGSSVSIMIHSNPTHIGNFPVASQEGLTIEYTIPPSVDPGIHTLHIEGETSEGEKITIYKNILVAVSENDWNGDGIDNSRDACGVFEPLGIDEDLDGTDDGCDGFIDRPKGSTMAVDHIILGQQTTPAIRNSSINNPSDGSESKQRGFSESENENATKSDKWQATPVITLLLLVFGVLLSKYTRRKQNRI